jgi:hypothetical protein
MCWYIENNSPRLTVSILASFVLCFCPSQEKLEKNRKARHARASSGHATSPPTCLILVSFVVRSDRHTDVSDSKLSLPLTSQKETNFIVRPTLFPTLSFVLSFVVGSRTCGKNRASLMINPHNQRGWLV